MPRREAIRWSALAGIAFVPRVVGALVHRPWHDEYFTAWAAGLPWARLVDALRVDSGPPLPYALAKLGALAGLTPILAGRAISVLAGTLAVVIAARATQRAYGTRAGMGAGVLLALHPLALAWASETRAYSLLLLASALVWDGLTRLRRDGRGAGWLGAGVALGCWSHGLGLVLAATAAVAGLALPAGTRRRALVATAAGLLSLAPWLPLTARQPAQAVAWMAADWRALTVPVRAVAAAILLPTAAPFGAFTDLPSPPIAVAVAVALVAAALLASARRDGVAWLLVALPAVGLTALAVLAVPVLYPGRAEALYLAPACALLASRVDGSRLAAAGVGGLALAGAATVAVGLGVWRAQPPRPEAVAAAAIRSALPSGGTIVTSGYWWLELWYHLDRGGGRYELVEVPAAAGRHPGWYDPGSDVPGPAELERLAARLATRASATAVVVTPGLATAAPLARLATHLGLDSRLRLPNGLVFLPPATHGPPPG